MLSIHFMFKWLSWRLYLEIHPHTPPIPLLVGPVEGFRSDESYYSLTFHLLQNWRLAAASVECPFKWSLKAIIFLEQFYNALFHRWNPIHVTHTIHVMNSTCFSSACLSSVRTPNHPSMDAAATKANNYFKGGFPFCRIKTERRKRENCNKKPSCLQRDLSVTLSTIKWHAWVCNRICLGSCEKRNK